MDKKQQQKVAQQKLGLFSYHTMSDDKFIDVERIIASKNERALKWMPRFLIRYLKRIIHQDEINAFIKKHKDKRSIDFCDAIIEDFNIKLSVKNIENIPTTGKVVLVMNHPLGGMDAPVLVSALKSRRTDLKFIVNDILMNLDNLKDLFVGVNKVGKNTTSLRDQINELFESDQTICIYPAGLVSRRKKGKIRDLTWKKTFVTYAKRHGQTVIPIYMDGRLSNFFYRLANIRKFFRIKANVEMLYLSNETFQQKNKEMKFVVGEPVSLEDYGDMSDSDIAQEIKELVYKLQKEA